MGGEGAGVGMGQGESRKQRWEEAPFACCFLDLHRFPFGELNEDTQLPALKVAQKSICSILKVRKIFVQE